MPFGFQSSGVSPAGLDGSPAPKFRRGFRLRDVFLGVAAMVGVLMGPGLYYKATGSTEKVKATVAGRVRIPADDMFKKFEIYTDHGNFNTLDLKLGGMIHEGCSYEFELKGARLKYWPPGYTRSAADYQSITTGVCPEKVGEKTSQWWTTKTPQP